MRRDSAEGLSKCARCKNRSAFAKGTARGLAAEGKTRQRTMVTYAGALESIYLEPRLSVNTADAEGDPHEHRKDAYSRNAQVPINHCWRFPIARSASGTADWAPFRNSDQRGWLRT